MNPETREGTSLAASAPTEPTTVSAALGRIHDDISDLYEAITSLEDRLDNVLIPHEPGKDSQPKSVVDVLVEEPRSPLTDGLNSAAGRVQSLRARLIDLRHRVNL